MPVHFYQGWASPAEQSKKCFHALGVVQVQGINQSKKETESLRQVIQFIHHYTLFQDEPNSGRVLDQCRGFPLEFDCTSPCQLHPNRAKKKKNGKERTIMEEDKHFCESWLEYICPKFWTFFFILLLPVKTLDFGSQTRPEVLSALLVKLIWI